MGILDAMKGADTLETVLESSGVNKLPAITCTVMGELTEDDLIVFEQERQDPQRAVFAPSTEFDIQKVRARHHSVARLLAQGLPESLVASMTDFDAATVSKLKNSPAVQELMAHYRGPLDAAAAAMKERLLTVGGLALDELTRRLSSDEAAVMPVAQIIAAGKLGLDRSGHGPAASMEVKSTHVEYDAARLAELHMRARRTDAELTIPLVRSLPPPEEV